MPKGVTSELLVEEENDDLEDRFDNSSFDDIFSFRFFKSFLIFSDESLIQKVNIYLLKLIYFLLTLPYGKMHASAKIFT